MDHDRHSPKRFRKKLRLENFDYTSPGAYFFTICTQYRKPIFGKVDGGQVYLSWKGVIVYQMWTGLPDHFPNVKLDEFVVMPNHLHGILWLLEREKPIIKMHPSPKNQSGHYPPSHLQPGSLSVIIRSFKSAVTRKINQMGHTSGQTLWQRSFYHHILRDDDDLSQHREYIIENPLRWTLDQYYWD